MAKYPHADQRNSIPLRKVILPFRTKYLMKHSEKIVKQTYLNHSKKKHFNPDFIVDKIKRRNKSSRAKNKNIKKAINCSCWKFSFWKNIIMSFDKLRNKEGVIKFSKKSI